MPRCHGRRDRDEQCDKPATCCSRSFSGIASEDGSFTLSDVIRDQRQNDPRHVFATKREDEDVLTEEIKRAKGDQPQHRRRYPVLRRRFKGARSAR